MLPANRIGKFTGRYIEPFLGGGSIFFSVRPSRAVLADKNSELIEVYLALRDAYQGVLRGLKIHSRNHSKGYLACTRFG